MDNQKIEALKTRQILNRRFVILKKEHVLGIFHRLQCILYNENDGYVTQKRIKFKLIKSDLINDKVLIINIDGRELKYIVPRYAMNYLNDYSITFKIDNAIPFFYGTLGN